MCAYQNNTMSKLKLKRKKLRVLFLTLSLLGATLSYSEAVEYENEENLNENRMVTARYADDEEDISRNIGLATQLRLSVEQQERGNGMLFTRSLTFIERALEACEEGRLFRFLRETFVSKIRKLFSRDRT